MSVRLMIRQYVGSHRVSSWSRPQPSYLRFAIQPRRAMLNMMQDIGDIIIRIVADGMVVPIVLLAAWVLLRLPREVRYQRLARGVVVGLVALWFAKVASIFYQEGERPFRLLGVHAKAAYLNNPGFPSDHVLFVFCITFVVWASTKSRTLGLIFLMLSSMVAVGRVAALVHTPLDVIGGIVCALLAATVVYGRQFYQRKQLPR